MSFVASRVSGSLRAAVSGFRPVAADCARCLSTALAPRAELSPADSDVTDWITTRSKNRFPSILRELGAKAKQVEDLVGLHNGMPNEGTFPIKGFSMTLSDDTAVELNDDEMRLALQYSETEGSPALRTRLRNMLLTEHRPPPKAADFAVSLSTGSQDALGRAFEMLVGPGDSILVENPTYPGALASMKPLGVAIQGVAVDELGLRDDELERTLVDWDETTQGPKPRVLYTIPVAANPTGATQSAERKRAIYAVCQKHNLLIMEDDPYYFLQFSKERVKSFLSMDVDGRVLRFDSFSKVMAAGTRLGMVSGPKDFVRRIDLHSQATVLHPSGLSQAVLLAFLRSKGLFESANDHGDLGGWEDLVQNVVSFYQKQCDAAVEAATKHLAGMFLWFKLLGMDDSKAVIEGQALSHKVLVVPGSYFMPNGEPSPYVRASFSHATFERMDVGFQRLAAAITEYKQEKTM